MKRGSTAYEATNFSNLFQEFDSMEEESQESNQTSLLCVVELKMFMKLILICYTLYSMCDFTEQSDGATSSPQRGLVKFQPNLGNFR